MIEDEDAGFADGSGADDSAVDHGAFEAELTASRLPAHATKPEPVTVDAVLLRMTSGMESIEGFQAGVEAMRPYVEKAIAGINDMSKAMRAAGVAAKRFFDDAQVRRFIGEEVDYNDAERLRQVLVGRKIVSINRTTTRKIKAEIRRTLEIEMANRYWEAVADWAKHGAAVGARPAEPKFDEYDHAALRELSGWDDLDVIEYTLDDGTVLSAYETDGGCACSNGCFSVELGEDTERRLIGATIMSVRTEERLEDSYGAIDDPDKVKVFVDGEGEGGYGSAEMFVFVYTDLHPPVARIGETSTGEPVTSEQDPLPLVSSAGSDNGYYGWGFGLRVRRVAPAGGERAALPASAGQDGD